jgi:hypothetical protein
MYSELHTLVSTAPNAVSRKPWLLKYTLRAAGQDISGKGIARDSGRGMNHDLTWPSQIGCNWFDHTTAHVRQKELLAVAVRYASEGDLPWLRTGSDFRDEKLYLGTLARGAMNVLDLDVVSFETCKRDVFNPIGFYGIGSSQRRSCSNLSLSFFNFFVMDRHFLEDRLEEGDEGVYAASGNTLGGGGLVVRCGYLGNGSSTNLAIKYIHMPG